ncbi:uncharacterized protein LOC129597786 [Paramacrobiotus metropolitanus]|uniref:uncharacterized protein LOC129597786 n=1 Tax=Paramacrobiotus metropolitanus TaxID=2943436 RepID=UPI002445841F|nr:uncharacterized protein LOC129597786 [Paramacrobiotus metropolitanus]
MSGTVECLLLLSCCAAPFLGSPVRRRTATIMPTTSTSSTSEGEDAPDSGSDDLSVDDTVADDAVPAADEDYWLFNRSNTTDPIADEDYPIANTTEAVDEVTTPEVMDEIDHNGRNIIKVRKLPWEDERGRLQNTLSWKQLLDCSIARMQKPSRWQFFVQWSRFSRVC